MLLFPLKVILFDIDGNFSCYLEKLSSGKIYFEEFYFFNDNLDMGDYKASSVSDSVGSLTALRNY